MPLGGCTNHKSSRLDESASIILDDTNLGGQIILHFPELPEIITQIGQILKLFKRHNGELSIV